MRKRTILALFVGIAFVVLAAVSFAQEATLTHSDAAKAIAEALCVKIVPDINTLPAEQHYEIYTNALASRGISNFVGTDPQDSFTVAELKAIYDIISAGKLDMITAAKQECPSEVAGVFGLAPEAGVTGGNLNKVLGCFPACDLTAAPYTAPVAPLTPEIPETTPEEPSSQIE